MRVPEAAGGWMYELIAELFPICRSITGEGLRDTLRRVQREIPLEIHEVASGTPVFDWTVPREWNIRDAFVKNSRGERVVDFRRSNLHVVNYSAPVSRRLSLEELRPHLFSLPEHPDWIPYRTSYYSEDWGFCLSHRQFEALPEDSYEVRIDSTLEPGTLSYGEVLIPGTEPGEILISTHACHPSLANDNLSGVAVAAALARTLGERRNRYSYRFLFIPGTIGSITWLARNEASARRIEHGLVLSCLGDAGPCTYKRSRRGNALVDRAAEHVLRHSGHEFAIQDFVPYGNDERQYCSPGFDLPVGCLMRSPHDKLPQYHTSADDLDLVRPEALADSLDKLLRIVHVLESEATYINQSPNCEPQLGKRGLYRRNGGTAQLPGYEMALLWVLSLADGTHGLLDMAQRAELPFEVIREAADALRTSGLLVDAGLTRHPVSRIDGLQRKGGVGRYAPAQATPGAP